MRVAFVASVVAALMLPGRGAAEGDAGEVLLRVENDTFVDLDYWDSSEVELRWISRPRWCQGSTCWRLGLGLGHRIATPRDILRLPPSRRDHPFAGRLYGDASALGHLGRDGSVGFRLRGGVLGPSAHGEEVQKALHTILQVRLPRAWDHQIPDTGFFELGGVFAFHRPLALDGLSLTPLLVGALDAGNLRAQLRVAAGVMLGHGFAGAAALPLWDGAVRAPPRCRNLCFGVLASAGLDLVLFDEVIEGRGLPTPPAIDARPWRARLRTGFVLGLHAFRLSFVHVLTSRSFDNTDGQRVHPEFHRWGVLELGGVY